MNFFERQDQARRMSGRLLLLFGIAVLGIVAAVTAVIAVFLGPRPGPLLAGAIGTLAVIGLGSLYRISSLGSGGEAIARELGGVQVNEDTRDPALRRLRNVVEEIAIASGVAVPKVFVLEQEAAINAFAAGYSPADAAIAVTRGALERLNRDELQGVIAHEFSHILNGDMRLNIRLVGALFGILMVGLIGRKVLEHGRIGGGRRGSGAVVVLVVALVAMLIGYVGLFFARMIKAGVSRSRERLADASAVQFTRQTAGLAGALKKIAGLHEGSRIAQRGDAEEVSHMLFGDGVGLRGWFATHPPLLERIQALEPSFGETELARLSHGWTLHPPHGLEEDVMLGLAGPHASPALPAVDAEHMLAPGRVVDEVAAPQAEDFVLAGAIVETLPREIHDLATRRESVMPLLVGLLLDQDAEVRERQLFEVAARMGAVVAGEAQVLREQTLATLHPMHRLPLAAIAFPVLRRRPKPELDVFLDAIHALVHADGKVSLFEYCVACLLTVQVRESLDPSRYARFGRSKLDAVRSEIATLLAVVAQHGHADADTARHAYLRGIQRALPIDALPYLPRAQGVTSLDDVWVALDALYPLGKQALVEALTVTISHDGRTTVAEAELLRTICAMLHCPLPPMLQPAPSQAV
ncbi:M48 family metallopeptidase [Aerolutibacter ruishenii]|uniref:Zn-dependent protease with chaperone function n=1 Tax=Aerolutibacter ruishenii TaxID=686800 RepID=A0A562LCW2_9GAMM|nr:M48 family metallopeptidase [Lysobacter ruishenii]TWI05396.1 Zn-dependent protease with chaperone function [Lysobacter ruishenii]